MTRVSLPPTFTSHKGRRQRESNRTRSTRCIAKVFSLLPRRKASGEASFLFYQVVCSSCQVSVPRRAASSLSAAAREEGEKKGIARGLGLRSGLCSPPDSLLDVFELRRFSQGDQAISGLDPLSWRRVKEHFAGSPFDRHHNHSRLLP